MSDIAIDELNREQLEKQIKIDLVLPTLLDGDLNSLSPETSQRNNYTIEDVTI